MSLLAQHQKIGYKIVFHFFFVKKIVKENLRTKFPEIFGENVFQKISSIFSEKYVKFQKNNYVTNFSELYVKKIPKNIC